MAAGGERILTQRELNRALLARQLLLERVALPLPRVVERLGGIQNQYAPNAYIRLWSCVEGFRRADLTRALERRSLVQGTLLRATIHLVSRRDYWSFAVGVRAAQRDWWLRVHRPRPDERRIEPRVQGHVASEPLEGRRVGLEGDRARGRPAHAPRRQAEQQDEIAEVGPHVHDQSGRVGPGEFPEGPDGGFPLVEPGEVGRFRRDLARMDFQQAAAEPADEGPAADLQQPLHPVGALVSPGR